jgi:serine/threonine protein kinase
MRPPENRLTDSMTGDYPSDCPEAVLFDNRLPAADIWSLGKILADLASAGIGSPLIGGNPGSPVEKLLHSRQYLGDLPAKYNKMIEKDVEIPPSNYSPDALLLGIVDNPVVGLNTNVPQFNGKELNDLVDLLRRMLAYDPNDRISADEALKHAFFSPTSR